VQKRAGEASEEVYTVAAEEHRMTPAEKSENIAEVQKAESGRDDSKISMRAAESRSKVSRAKVKRQREDEKRDNTGAVCAVVG